MTINCVTRGVALALVWLCACAPAIAQGNRGAPPGQVHKPPKGSGSNSSTASDPGVIAAPTVEPRTFGTWLDDATLAPGGSVWLTVAATRWSTPTSHGVDAPSVGVAAGLTPRAQLSLAVPYSRFSSGDQAFPGGMGDVYAGVKLLAARPSAGHIGVSVSPTLEILNSPGASRRAGLVLPVSVEGGSGAVRGYGTTGFFTRGAVFASGALEYHVSPRASVTGSLLRSWSTADAAANDALGLSRTRTDASGTVVAFVSSSIAMFGSVSRTISRQEFDSSRFVVSGGVAFVLTPANQIPVRPPR